MSPHDDAVEALIRELGVTHCPSCQTPITPTTVKPGWDNREQWEHALGGRAWLACCARVDKGPGQRFCAHHLSSTFALLCSSGSQEDADMPHGRTAIYAAGARAYRIVSCIDGESFENSWGSACV